MAKNPLRTFFGMNREKNKNIKAWPKKRSSYKKKCSLFIGAKKFQEIVKVKFLNHPYHPTLMSGR